MLSKASKRSRLGMAALVGGNAQGNAFPEPGGNRIKVGDVLQNTGEHGDIHGQVAQIWERPGVEIDDYRPRAAVHEVGCNVGATPVKVGHELAPPGTELDDPRARGNQPRDQPCSLIPGRIQVAQVRPSLKIALSKPPTAKGP